MQTTMIKILYLLGLLLIDFAELKSQCGAVINSFPYTEGFETSDGGWVSGGVGNDWTWGTPAKPLISSAGGGTRCWIVGGLTGSSYTNAEASWIQSPCFDFTNLNYPLISFKINWETEQQFDGASFQYSIDNGSSWITIGPANYTDCIQKNWFNQDPVTYLSPLTAERRGWSGNMQATSGGCRGGGGSNGWVTATTIAPGLAFRPSVIFRFIFGAGTICNNYDGAAVDDMWIGEAPPNEADFTYSCVNNNTISFTNTSALCPSTFSWNFGDPVSGVNNTSAEANPSHTFSAPGTYNVTLTVSGPGNAPSTKTKQVTALNVTTTMLTMADCQTNTGGSLIVSVEGTTAPLNTLWSTAPPQTTTIASNLAAGDYSVTVSGAGICTVTAPGKVETDLSCIAVYFPTGFTPNDDGKNDSFGPLGSLVLINNYQFSIYNRWGEKVFFSTNPFEKWDGKVRGKRADANSFVWIAEFTLPGKPREFRKGIVALIR